MNKQEPEIIVCEPIFQAVTTKYLGPTNHRGSRIKATTESGHSLTVSWQYELNSTENHRRAAMALLKKLEWGGKWIGGGTKDGYVFCSNRGLDK